jgi:hypothetical protein
MGVHHRLPLEDDPVSDALDSLQNRLQELKAAGRRVVIAYDLELCHSSDMDAVIETLRELSK